MRNERRLRIALVHTYHWDEVRRGGERYLSDLAWYLSREGHDVDVVVTAEGSPPLTAPADAEVVTARRIVHPRLAARGIGANDTLALSVLPRLLRRRYDVVHCLLPAPVLAARLARQRVVYSEIGHPSLEWRAQQPGGLALYRRVVGSATAVTALSASAADALRHVGGRGAEILPPGVRLDHFSPRRERCPEPTLLFVSDASERRKGLDVAVAAFARLRRVRPTARLVLAGPGDPSWALSPYPALRDAIDVIGVGEREELPSLYSSAWVTVLPSSEEAFGLVLVESLACGTPVVASDTGGIRGIVTPEVGRLAPPGDAGALSGALAEALDLASAPGVVDRCRSRAATWGWEEHVGPAHEALYRRVCTR